eukprot:5426243-Heterocapsa_arctica.AAC.1
MRRHSGLPLGRRFVVQPVALDLPEDTLSDHHIFKACPDVVSPVTTSFCVYSSRGFHFSFISSVSSRRQSLADGTPCRRRAVIILLFLLRGNVASRRCTVQTSAPDDLFPA